MDLALRRTPDPLDTETHVLNLASWEELGIRIEQLNLEPSPEWVMGRMMSNIPASHGFTLRQILPTSCLLPPRRGEIFGVATNTAGLIRSNFDRVRV